MKQLKLMKTLLVVALLCVGTSNVWGDKVFLTTMTGTVGKTDLSGDWWTYCSKYQKIADGETYVLTFVNHNTPSADYSHANWYFELTDGSAEGYYDAQVDGGAAPWGGTLFENKTQTGVYTSYFSTAQQWNAAYNGANVTLTVTRSGNVVTATHTSICTDASSTVFSGTMSTTYAGEDDVYFYIVAAGGAYQEITKVVYTEADGKTKHTYNSTIDALPFSRTWTAGDTADPFDAGTVVTGTNAVGLRAGDGITATALFNSDGNGAAYSLRTNEKVTMSFRAYHGTFGYDQTGSFSVVNSDGVVLAGYTYSSNGAKITNVIIGGTTHSDFTEEYVCQSRQTNSSNAANGFTGNGRPYANNNEKNPFITITICKNGEVSLNISYEELSINNTYKSNLVGIKMDLAKLTLASNDYRNSAGGDDRELGINNLSITSEILTPPTVSISASSSMIKKDKTVTLTADVTGDSSIQWYSNTTNSSEGGVAIPSATETTYNPSTASNGTTYYYAIATNLIGNTVSNIVPITVATYQDEFSAVGKSVAKTIPYNTSDEELTSTNANISGGHMYVSNYKSGDDQTVVTSGGKFQMNGNAVFFKVVLNDALQAGDIISASVGNKTGYGISIYAEYSTGGKPSTGNHADLSTTKDDFETKTYTIKNSDTYLIGQNTFYVYRLTTNGTYFDNLTVSRPNVVSGKIGSTGWTTFSSNYKLDLNDVSGGDASAYYASSSDENTVTLKTTTDIVNSDEGLLIKGTAGETFTIAKSSSDATFSQTNLLVGCPNGETLTQNANYYVLVSNGGTAEFQSLATNGATIPAGKAYLNAGATNARSLSIVFDENETGIKKIESVASNKENGAYYNLAGQRIAQPTKGLYIVNGKKVVIK